MTTTQTPTKTCQGIHCDEAATTVVYAQHFDPDLDEDGRPIGWSRRIRSLLCDDCMEEWKDDELVAICDLEPLT